MAERYTIGKGGLSPAGAATVRKLVLTIGGVVLIAALIIGVPSLKHALTLIYAKPPYGKKLAYFGKEGLVLTTASGKEEVPLRAKSGIPVADPMGTFVQGKIAYYSKEDLAVHVMNSSKVGNWIDVGSGISTDSKMTRLSTDGTSIYLTFKEEVGSAGVSSAARPLHTVKIDPNKGVGTLYGEGDFYVFPGGTMSRDQQGNFVLRKGNSEKQYGSWPNAYIWDFNQNTGLLALAQGSTLILVMNGKTTEVTPAMLHAIHSITIDRSTNEVHVEVKRPLGGARVMSFDAQGQYKGLEAVDKSRAAGPYLPVTVELKNALNLD